LRNDRAVSVDKKFKGRVEFNFLGTGWDYYQKEIDVFRGSTCFFLLGLTGDIRGYLVLIVALNSSLEIFNPIASERDDVCIFYSNVQTMFR
jgi:hypothetical protein